MQAERLHAAANEDTRSAGISAESGDLPAGFVVGEYRIRAPIGRGGMGTVYAAEHPLIGKQVAIKVLAGARSADARLVRRFVDEARAVNKIAHPNIIDIFAFGALADGRQYFVMECLPGATLARRLTDGDIDAPPAQRWFLQICDALEAAHRERIVHRDLKPENVWITTPKYGDSYVKLLDFGIAKLADAGGGSPATEVGVLLGSAHYMSPEQCLGRDVDHRTDIYAVGVILYRAFAGCLPFRGDTFAEVVSQQITAAPAPPSFHRPVAPPLERVILSCLEKDPDRRPQSARSLRDDLSSAFGTAARAWHVCTRLLPNTRLAAAVSATPALAPIPRRRRGLIVSGLLAVGIAGAGTLGMAWRPKSDPTSTRDAPARVPAPKVVTDTPKSTGLDERALRHLRQVLSTGSLTPAQREATERELLRLQQKLGELELRCDLAGAAVTIDGELRGHTPIEEPIVLHPGEHRLSISRHGFETLDRIVTVVAGDRTYVNVRW